MKMYKQILFILFSFLGTFSAVVAQNISKAEYFMDKDPGIGKGIQLTLSFSGDTVKIETDIPMNQVLPGMHCMVVRVCDTSGNWSTNSSRTFFVFADSSQNLKIKAAEYYLDKDPGVGKAQPFSGFAADTTIKFDETIYTGNLSARIYSLNARVQYDNGMWSQSVARVFNADTGKLTSGTLQKVEYFIDSDPGLNASTQFDDNLSTNTYNIEKNFDLSSLSDGWHSLSVRAKTDDGFWSVNSSESFYIFSADQSPINHVEAYIDNDPGFGKAYPVSINDTGLNIIGSGDIDIAGLATGFHKLTVRARDEKGNWSIHETKQFVVIPPKDSSLLEKMEYFYDADPGVRKATSMDLDITANKVTIEKEFSVIGLDSGVHYMATRFMDTSGNVSITETRKFVICDLLPEANFHADTVCFGDSIKFLNQSLNVDLNSQYFWDIDNNGSNEYNSLNASHLYEAAGNYQVRLIVSNGGLCADTIVKNVFIDNPLVATVSADGPTEFCEGMSVNLIGNSGFLSYEWSNGSTGNQNTIFEAGIYYFIGKNKFCADTSNLIEISLKPLPLTPNVEARNGGIYADEKNYIQWYEINKGLLSGETSDILIPMESGKFYVIAGASNGCYSIPSDTITFVYDSLNCFTDFTYEIDTINLKVNFVNLSAPSAKARWNFGDGTYSFNFNPAHTYIKPGKYTVCLTSYDTISGCLKKICKDVIVGEIVCSSLFAYKINHLTRTVVYTDLSSSTTEWYWSFGDGTLAKTRDASYTYTSDGSYKVCHWVRNKATACFDQTCVEIRIGKEDTTILKAAFTYYAGEGSTNVEFSNKSSDNATNYYWTFGDGDYSTDESPIHEYGKAGTYKVCLSVFDKTTGKVDEYCETIFVGDNLICNLSADFSSIAKETREVIFYNKSVGDGDRYYWSFGDGATSTANHPVHQYDSPGYYLVSLAVRNSSGTCYDYTSQLVKVGEVACKAMFDFQVDPLNNTVVFSNKSTGNINNNFWHFGNGNYSAEKNPSFYFEKDGLYKVTLTVSNLLGTCMDNYSAYIQNGKVNCDAKFTYYVDSLNNKAYFNDEIIGTSTNLLWSFGDGTVASVNKPVHKYAKSGYYKVGLNTFNLTDWCMDYYEETILVGSSGNDCESDFIYLADTSETQVKFFDKSKGKIIGYIWNFGDGTIESEMNPVHVYSRPGYYNVCHMVVNNDLITNLKCKPVIAASGNLNNCRADFSFSVDSATRTVYLADASEGAPAKWTWNLGNGTTAATRQVTVKYTKSGFYLVDLKIGNSVTGCNSRIVKMINVAQSGDIKAGFLFEEKERNTKAGGYPVDFVGAGSGDQARLRWDFGDGTVDSTTNSPTHQYANPGSYKVCYEVSDPVTGQKDSVCQMIVIAGDVNVKESALTSNNLNVFPNPVQNELIIKYKIVRSSKVYIKITDLHGKEVTSITNTWKNEGNHEIYFDAGILSNGTYILQMKLDNGEIFNRVIVKL